MNPLYYRALAVFNSVIVAGLWPVFAVAAMRDWTVIFVPLLFTATVAMQWTVIRKVHGPRRVSPHPDYAAIAAMEREVYGEVFEHDGAPRIPSQPRSGTEQRGDGLWTQADFEYWTTGNRDRDGKIMADAIEKGLLVNLGIGKPRRPGPPQPGAFGTLIEARRGRRNAPAVPRWVWDWHCSCGAGEGGRAATEASAQGSAQRESGAHSGPAHHLNCHWGRLN